MRFHPYLRFRFVFFLRFHFRRIRKSRFQKFGAFPKRFLRLGNANHVSLNSAVFARGDFGNVICVSEAFPETFGKTPLETQKAYRKRDSRFRPHFGEKNSNGTLGNVIFVSIRKLRFPIYRRGVSETPRAFRKRPERFPNSSAAENLHKLRFQYVFDAFSLGFVKKVGWWRGPACRGTKAP